ncbi:hypothetical protein COBT_003593, partial [Conglomerata obtusa]
MVYSSEATTRYDMASAMEATDTFDGREEQEAMNWLKEVKMVCELTNFNEQETLKLIILKLKGTARTWCTTLYDKHLEINLNDFIRLFRNRFTNNTRSQETLERFLARELPEKKKDYMEMLKAANNIYDSKLLNEQALVKFVITKSPIPIRAMLFQVAGRDYDWQEVYKIAVESIWIAYPNQNIQDNSELLQENIFYTKKKYLHKTQPKKYESVKPAEKERLFCELHGKGNHDTYHCFTIIKLKNLGYEKKKIYAIQNGNNDFGKEELSEEKENFLIKKNNSYKPFNSLNIHSISNKIKSNSCTKPFNIQIKFFEQDLPAIIDTGADISVINAAYIPKKHLSKMQANKSLIYSASGTMLCILGKIENCKIEINNKIYMTDFYVTKDFPKETILGFNFINRNIQLLTDCINKLEATKFKLLFIPEKNNLELQFFEKYKDLFKTEISDMNICNIGKHNIRVENKNPIKQNNYRIPVNFEKQID